MEPELPNAERKLDGARFFLELLERTQDEPRAFYHYLGALLSNVKSVDYALRTEDARYIAWRKSWSKQLTSEEQTLVGKMFNLRDRDVHNKGLPLSVALAIRVTANVGDATVSIKPRKEGSSANLTELSVGAGMTGMFEDCVNATPRVATPEIMRPGGFTADVRGDTRALSFRVVPRYQFESSTLGNDALDCCRALLALAERLLTDYRDMLPSGNAV
jgi:hypothetical protein